MSEKIIISIEDVKGKSLFFDEKANENNATEAVSKAINDFLVSEYGHCPEYICYPDGDGDGWKFWIEPDDDTSYVHDDLSIEWYGSSYEPIGGADGQD